MKANPEPTRVREQGTKVTNSALAADPGQARISALREIVQEKQYAVIDGLMVDLFSASIIVQVYDTIKPENQAKLLSLPIRKMAAICLRVAK